VKRADWQIAEGRDGLPQQFRLGDFVQIRQDGSAPMEWSPDWSGIRLQVVGVRVDEYRPGRACYYVQARGDLPEIDTMAEDWLETCR
jgi:hypothetical protein